MKISELSRALMARTPRGRAATRALATVKELDADALNAFVAESDLESGLNWAGHAFFSTDDQAEIIRVLTEDRLNDLNNESRIKIIEALQSGLTFRAAEEGVARIFLATTDEAELRELRNRCDHGGTHQDLAKLIFDDIGDEEIRQSILEHIERYAGDDGGLKILSDVDDTFAASIHDSVYPRGTVYPGAVRLYEELDRGPASTPNPYGDITFITARPGDPFGLFESGTHELVKSGGLKPSTVLTGSATHLFSHASMAEKKVQNFHRYRLLFPDYSFVFFGDNGQGDIDFAEQLIDLDADVIYAVYIHKVIGVEEHEEAALAQRDILLIDTHPAAATDAFRRGLLTGEQLRRVIDSARNGFADIDFNDDDARQCAFDRLERDLRQAEAALA